MLTMKRFGIVGAGPIGTTLATYLLSAGHDVALVDIDSRRLDALRDQGLAVTGVMEQRARGGSLATSVTEFRDHPVDIVLIAVKVGHMAEVLVELEKVLGGSETLCSCQNGLDPESMIADRFGPERTLRMVINYAGNILEDQQVEMTFFNKPNYIGALAEPGIAVAQYIAYSLTSVGLDTATTGRIRRHAWEKTILNASLAGICALTNTTMREVMSYAETEELVGEFIREGIEVARADGMDFDDDFHGACVSYLSKGGHHKPTMLVDLLAGRRTEVAFLNGRIVDYGARYGIPTPYNKSLTAMVKLIQEGRQA